MCLQLPNLAVLGQHDLIDGGEHIPDNRISYRRAACVNGGEHFLPWYTNLAITTYTADASVLTIRTPNLIITYSRPPACSEVIHNACALAHIYILCVLSCAGPGTAGAAACLRCKLYPASLHIARKCYTMLNTGPVGNMPTDKPGRVGLSSD